MAQTITRGYKALIDAAEQCVETIDVSEALERLNTGAATFIDLRDIRELRREGRMPGAFHCPRGMLEFWIDPESPYHNPVFSGDGPFVFFCAAGWRSVLAARTAMDMGLAPVCHIDGGFSAWIEAGGPVETGERGDRDHQSGGDKAS